MARAARRVQPHAARPSVLRAVLRSMAQHRCFFSGGGGGVCVHPLVQPKARRARVFPRVSAEDAPDAPDAAHADDAARRDAVLLRAGRWTHAHGDVSRVRVALSFHPADD